MLLVLVFFGVVFLYCIVFVFILIKTAHCTLANNQLEKTTKDLPNKYAMKKKIKLIKEIDATSKYKNTQTFFFFKVHCLIFWSPKPLAWPIAIALRQPLCVVYHPLTNCSFRKTSQPFFFCYFFGVKMKILDFYKLWNLLTYFP